MNSYFKSAASRQHSLSCLVWNPDNPQPSITQVMRRSIQIDRCITKWLLRAIARFLTLLSSNSFQGCLQSLTDFVDKHLFVLGIVAVSIAGIQVCRCSFHSNPVSYRTHKGKETIKICRRFFVLVTRVTAQGRNLGITEGKKGKRKIYQLLKIYFGIVLTQEL